MPYIVKMTGEPIRRISTYMAVDEYYDEEGALEDTQVDFENELETSRRFFDRDGFEYGTMEVIEIEG